MNTSSQRKAETSALLSLWAAAALAYHLFQLPGKYQLYSQFIILIEVLLYDGALTEGTWIIVAYRLVLSTSEYFKMTQSKQHTFLVSLGFRLAFPPKTSFPWDCLVAFWELDPAEGWPLTFLVSICLSLDIEVEDSGGCCLDGFPSKRLPTPVKGLNLGSASAGGSSSVRKKNMYLVAFQIWRKRKILPAKTCQAE